MTIDEIEKAAEAAHKAAATRLEILLEEKAKVLAEVKTARADVEKADRAVKAFRKRGKQ
jgi:hypothetical protein